MWLELQLVVQTVFIFKLFTDFELKSSQSDLLGRVCRNHQLSDNYQCICWVAALRNYQ